ncbi:MAG: beta-propeller domain-containing protein [Myxococcota bacterium]|nr:beta-propeller domain-containing protein [Myxococcota bacterium]
MASSRTCDGLRELMIDTVVHQTVVGYSPYANNGRRHFHRRQPVKTPANNKRRKRMAKPVAPSSFDGGGEAGAPMPTAPVTASRSHDFSAEQHRNEMPAPSGPGHYTTTNVQEKGVDEADIIKTDGKFIYTVRANELVIAKTWPVDKTSIAARVTFKTLHPQHLYLRGTDVIVQGQTSEQLQGWGPQARTRVIVIDASNRESPTVKKIVDVDGHSVSSRVVRNDLFLVQATQLQISPKLYEVAKEAMGNASRPDQQTLRPWEAQAALARSLRSAVAAKITTSDVDNALPRIRNGVATKQMACSDLHIPPNNIQMQMTTLAKISLAEPKGELVGAMVTGAQVYASPTTMYVTAPHYVTTAKGYDYGTQVHQFALGDDNTRPSYVASGRVDGMLLNQFSMSEWKGDLRIATTDQNMTSNNLFVMRPFGKTLGVIGSVRGMGKGERIYSGRLVGDQGYLVTFRQTDPLYTLDLKDPTNPKVAGELKVNGFSSYIHPIGDGLLLTIGQDADANGRQLGVHMQVFDVKNPAKPTRKFHETLGVGTQSTAQNDHKAFLWDPKTSTFAVPLVHYANNQYFQGLVVYNLDKQKGFTSKGRVDHSELGTEWVDEQCAVQRKAAPKAKLASLAYCNPTYQKQYRAQHPISRSLIIDEYILSLSNLGFEIHALSNLEDAKASVSWTAVQKKTAIAR